MSEDPIGSEGKDANLYRYSSNNPPVRVDPLGLEWQVDRKGEPRAIATCERCDRVEDLAKKLDLWPSEFRKWLKDEDGKGLPETAETEMTESRKFSVPNTAYLHVGKWQVGPIRWALKGYEDGLKSRLEKAGLLVDYNAPTSVALMAAQLPSPDVFVFACFGHGIFGCLQPNPLQSHENFSDTNLMPKTYTQFGIAEMHLIACETHAGDWEWRADAARSIPGRSAKPGIRASRRVGNRRAVRARIGAPHYNLGEAARRQTERSHGPLR